MIELAAIVGMLLVLVTLCLILVGPGGRLRASARPIRDAANVRQMAVGMISWAEYNNGSLPVPGAIDTDNATVFGSADSKNTTGNLLSLLIFNGAFAPGLCVADVESNRTQVRVMSDYSRSEPRDAAQPSDALWDPAFCGTPIDAPPPSGRVLRIANQSYATPVLCGARKAQWASPNGSILPILCNRGPQYAVDDFASSPATGRWTLLDGPTGSGSHTLMIHGSRWTWDGLVALSDGGVTFETKPTPDGVTYTTTAATNRTRPDNLFVNESDEQGGDSKPGEFQRGKNAFLRPVARYEVDGTPVMWRD